ncbi:MAG TPA: efflux transporter outer membrane subunit [Blastocatellia bacterium]|nr:efflux transporter outer membrane subunit [Blastocatellia bacterium]
MSRRSKPAAWLAISSLVLTSTFWSACNVGPTYKKPAVDVPGAYKELEPLAGWKTARPNDAVLRGKWWETFNDPHLSQLEEKLNISNQNIAAAAAAFAAARAMVREARSQYFPSLNAGPAITKERTPLPVAIKPGATFTEYSATADASWEPDLWGRVRNSVKAAAFAAQLSAADLENVRLSSQAELAADYFQLRGQDALKQLFDSTVAAYQDALSMTRALYESGLDSDESVASAEAQLKAAQAQDINLGVLRAQYEHAIAVLVGQPASQFSVPIEVLKPGPPAIPVGLPSELLERRPDIAAAERAVAQANAEIGVAKAAYYPNVTLGATGGFASTVVTSLFSWPSRLWSLGASAAETVFDAGLRKATVKQSQAVYDQTVANYRETVLTAFEQVEDNLATLRILSEALEEQDSAVKAAERNLDDASTRYRAGLDPYLNVITAQTTLLTAQQAAESFRIQQMVASVQLIKAVGGGWDQSSLPSPKEVAGKE